MRIYISGIGGRGAFHLARYFLALGADVYGSDLSNSPRIKRLKDLGANVLVGEPSTDRLEKTGKFNLYIYTSALPANHKEKVWFCQKNVQSIEVGQLTQDLIHTYFKGKLTRIEQKAVERANLIPLSKIDWNARKYIAVTGTDGKTTTVEMLGHMLRKLGKNVATISTVKVTVGEKTIDTGLHTTTPSAQELYKLLTSTDFLNVDVIVIEVTSQALAMGRLAGAKFDLALVTNITSDHLDYHTTYENYFNTKFSLISKHLKSDGCAILNSKSQGYHKLCKLCEEKNIDWLDASIENPQIRMPPSLKTSYNQLNASLAIETIRQLFPQLDLPNDLLSDFPGVTGRMQILQKRPFMVVVDFAHTESAMREFLNMLRGKLLKNSRLHVVFGCAGGRDKTKRAPMGKIAEKFADEIYLAPEDPRMERVADINEDILAGMNNFHKVHTFEEESPKARKNAIKAAIENAQTGDIVAILGKGHERSICFGTTEYPWSDVKTVQKILSSRKLT